MNERPPNRSAKIGQEALFYSFGQNQLKSNQILTFRAAEGRNQVKLLAAPKGMVKIKLNC
jgi:hypothetical protein